MRVSCYLLFLALYCIWSPLSVGDVQCGTGLIYHPTWICIDEDECQSSPCHPPKECQNVHRSYKCVCARGFHTVPGDPTSSKETTCSDVDECEDADVCGVKATCYNSYGSYHCICPSGFQSEPGGAQPSCQVSPLNCPEAERRNNSNPVQCDPEHSKTQKKLNPLDEGSCSMTEQARRLLDKVCQNFSTANDSQAVIDVVNGLLNRSSLWANVDVTEQLNAVAALLDLMENLAMRIALTLPRPGTKTISKASFDFAAVSLLVFSDLESILNSELHGEGSEVAEGTVPLNSKVITVTVSNKAASHQLTEVVSFTLELNQEYKGTEDVKCVYWKRTAVDSFWSSEGCTMFGVNQTHVMCQCNHLTSFAILMAPIELEDDFALTVITYVGLTISLLCLAASIIVFTKCHSIQNCNTTVHLHLSINLFLAQILFLIGYKVIGNKILCAVVAGCLHYLFLTVFAWMLLDALQLFMACRHLTVKAYTHTHIIRRSYLYPSGYAVSALIVIISAAINPRGYGSEKSCWLSLEAGFRWSFQGPVCFIIAVNLVLFIWTMVSLRHHLTSRDTNVSKIKDTRTLTLKAGARLFVLGCTWIFGIFNVSENTIIFSYIFTILNTLQGVFIFLIYCVFNDQVRNDIRRYFHKARMSSLTDSTNIALSSPEMKTA
ncbi:adhesion G protein-coupled receptor E3-like isoform X2 [Mustelus asterias]